MPTARVYGHAMKQLIDELLPGISHKDVDELLSELEKEPTIDTIKSWTDRVYLGNDAFYQSCQILFNFAKEESANVWTLIDDELKRVAGE
jgi:hypothetical protein